MGFWKDFVESAVETTATGLTGSLVEGTKGGKSGLGTMLSEGTQSDFDKYVQARQAAVKGEYDKYTAKFDAFEQQAKEFASLVGSPTPQNLSTELDGMEVAARYMQGKSQAEIQDTIKKLKAIRDEGGNVREKMSDYIKRGANQDVRNYTAQDIARMQLGGAFSYTPKPYDLSKRRTGLARFLRDDLGLYGETFAKERETLAERQARDVTASLPGFEKYSATGATQYDRPQASISLGGLDLRTEAQKRIEDLSKTQLAGAKANLAKTEQATKFAKNAEQRAIAAETRAQQKWILEQKSLKAQGDANELLLAKRRYENYQAQTDLGIKISEALENNDFKLAASLQSKFDRNDRIINTQENVQNYVDRQIKLDPTFAKAYKAGVTTSEDKAGIGQEGYSPEVRKAKIDGFRVRGMVAQLELIAQDNSVEALDAISDTGFGGLDFTSEDVIEMKTFVTVRALANARSEKGASVETKIQNGIKAHLERQGIEPTEENIAEVKGIYNNIGRYLGVSTATKGGGTTTPPDKPTQPKQDEQKAIEQKALTDAFGKDKPKPKQTPGGPNKAAIELSKKDGQKVIDTTNDIIRKQDKNLKDLKQLQQVSSTVEELKQRNPNAVGQYLLSLRNLGISNERDLIRSIGERSKQDVAFTQQLNSIRNQYGTLIKGFKDVPKRILPEYKGEENKAPKGKTDLKDFIRIGLPEKGIDAEIARLKKELEGVPKDNILTSGVYRRKQARLKQLENQRKNMKKAK